VNLRRGGNKKKKDDKKLYPSYLIGTSITSSEEIHIAVHVGTNMLIFDLVLAISLQVPCMSALSKMFFYVVDFLQLSYLQFCSKVVGFGVFFSVAYSHLYGSDL